VPEWYEIPVFYFSNHRSIVGHESRVKKPEYTNELDFELEVACVIKKKGKNIPHERALEYIAGFTILNDWSARDEQRKEMAVGLGPAKGKDFATSMGPYLVTPDELEDRRSGEHWDLKMRARINGKEVSSGNVKSLYWSFARMIERASRDCELFPGDVIGSGTVGTGCILELGTDVHRYLEPGDVVELEVERLGILKNLII
jgi:2-keto-4-pentenoate hydratase/2-oxohepta-3-ene-1,7-dioic acid hydratase in catechol pathway